jgi:hypothetical protein
MYQLRYLPTKWQHIAPLAVRRAGQSAPVLIDMVVNRAS